MKTLLDGLRQYLAETSPEKIAEDWAKSEHLKDVGPTVEEFLSSLPVISCSFDNPLADLQLKNTNLGNKPEQCFGLVF